MNKRHLQHIRQTLGSLTLLLHANCFASGGDDSSYTELMGQPILSPSNDSRINIALLLADAKKINLASYTFGSIEIVNDEEHSPPQVHHAFLTQDIINTLYPQAEEQQKYKQSTNTSSFQDTIDAAEPLLQYWLKEANLSLETRRALFNRLVGVDTQEQSAQIADWVAYLDARNTFYANDYPAAQDAFAELTTSSEPWIAETATYNLIRAALRSAIGVDEYGFASPQLFDRSAANQALADIQYYLETYPKGRYKNSAEGLKRRAFWLKNDIKNIGMSYSAVINSMPKSNSDNFKLVQEMDLYGVFCNTGYDYDADKYNITPEKLMWENKTLATAQWLLNLRHSNSSTINLNELLKPQEKTFNEAGQTTHFRFLRLSAEFYQHHNYDAVIAATQDWKTLLTDKSYLATSMIVLRAFALQAKQDFNASSDIWKSLKNASDNVFIKQYIEQAQAAELAWSNQLLKVFSDNSTVTAREPRETLIKNSATAEQLKKLLDSKNINETERNLAAKTLVTKFLAHGNYKELYQSYLATQHLATDTEKWHQDPSEEGTNAPQEIACSDTESLLKDLTLEKPNSLSKLCLAAWTGNTLAAAQYDEGTYSQEQKIARLGSPINVGMYQADGFKGERPSQTSLYTDVLADASASSDHKAYALYRLLHCFRSTNFNYCYADSNAYPTEQRKKWFTQLKTQYKNTSWAELQKVYW